MDIHAIVKRLKQQKQGQVSKLLLKSEAEIELLETIKEYMSVCSYNFMIRKDLKSKGIIAK